MRGDSPDGMLQTYLCCSDEGEADRQLGRILEELARPLARRIVNTVLHDATSSDAEDAVGDTIVDLLRRLRELRGGTASHPIHDLRGYIVTSAYHRCHERLRERYPARNRLRNQLQYLCGHDRALALWRGGDGALVCGLRDWRGREPLGSEDAEAIHLTARSDPTAEDRAQVAALVKALFFRLGAPLGLDVLVAAIARLIRLDHVRAEVGVEELVAEPGASLELRMSLERLWEDVRQLSERQRVALLLNLRDVHGRECLSLLPLTRTATIAQIADAVGIPPAEFAELWNELPLSDAAIAQRLQATQRQVIKLRRLARERLRRMEKTREHRNLGAGLDSSAKGTTIATRR
jgi:RNA polymerase sigma factor (sigma-70 family)